MREFKTEVNRKFGYLYHLYKLQKEFDSIVVVLGVVIELSGKTKKIKDDMRKHLEGWR